MSDIWLIGAGAMGIEYSKVLDDLNVDYLTIGRGEVSALHYKEVIGHDVILGGIEQFLLLKTTVIPQLAIVATPVMELASVAIKLMRAGVKKILLEKPGCCNPDELAEMYEVQEFTGSRVFLAYNRRFYSSVFKAEEIIRKDDGITSFNFEFTEWSHVVEKSGHSKQVLSRWLLANSSHVIDLAFFLGGNPVELSSFTAGKLLWHNPSIFSGAGITDKGALFNYHANWSAPGRWSVEVLTSLHRIYLRPMEKISVQDIGSIAINEIVCDNSLDISFKPGLYLQTKAFLSGDYSRLCTLDEQIRHVETIYMKISKRM